VVTVVFSSPPAVAHLRDAFSGKVKIR